MNLSPRQLQILQLSADGLTAEQIALDLSLAVDTILYHRRHIYIKLGADNITHAVALAIRRHLIQ